MYHRRSVVFPAMAAGATIIGIGIRIPQTAMLSRGRARAYAVVVEPVASFELLEISQKFKKQFPFLLCPENGTASGGHLSRRCFEGRGR